MSPPTRLAALLVSLGALALAAPEAVFAGTMQNSGGTLTINSGATDDSVYFEPVSVSEVRVITYGTTYAPADLAGCAFLDEPYGPGSYKRYRCFGEGNIAKIVVNAGEGNDNVGTWTGTLTHPLELHGGTGSDGLYGGPLADKIYGDEGNDYLGGEDGADTLDGGADSDSLYGGNGADDMIGGAGFDEVAYYDKSATQPVTVTLDDSANDGESGEGDNARSSIEDITGGEAGDVLVGSSGPNEIDGGGGADIIEGRAGTDRLDGGAGTDRVISRDGNAERVDCGADVDEATSDTIDDVSSCETNNASSDLQADRDADGFNAPTDCNDSDKAINPGAADTPDDGIDQNCDGADAQNLDKDRDGFNKDADCDDNNPNAKPGGTEVVGNEVDENCDGLAPPTPLVETPVFPGFFHFKGITRVTKFFGVGELEAGTTVIVRCKGKKRAGCPKKKTVKKVIKKQTKKLSFFRYYRRAKLRKGATIEVEITRPGFVGRLIVFKIKPKAVPTPKPLCIHPGETKAREC